MELELTESMGRQRKLKQQKRKNEKAEAESEIFPTIEFMFNEEFMLDEDMNPNQPENFTDIVLRQLMPVLPSFSGKNFELWAIKMEGLLGSVDLWKFVQETSINSNEKCRRAVALFLIISALDENILSSILNEFGEVFDPKMFWHILEMKYSMKWSHKDEIDEIVDKNSDCVEGIISGIETKSMSLVDNRIACDSQEIPFDAKTSEVKFDENYVSHEEWLCLMHEKQLIDELLFGERICLSPYTNHMQDDMFETTELIKEVEDMNQPTMKDEDLQNNVDIAQSKIVEESIAAHEAVEDSRVADEVVKDLIKGDDLKKVNSPFKEKCVGIDSEENASIEDKCKSRKHQEENAIKLEKIASIEDKSKFRKHPAMVNGKNVSLQSRKEKLHHYLMAKKVKIKLRLQINKYGPFRKKTKMKALYFCKPS